jgi:hypothetical protein
MEGRISIGGESEKVFGLIKDKTIVTQDDAAGAEFSPDAGR